MHMDTVKSTANEASPVTVQKIAYCDAHCPANTGGNDSFHVSAIDAERLRQESRNKMKQARKTLAMKRESVPLILIPTIPTDRVQQITSLVHFQKKSQFVQRLIAYWTLKRQHRNGVPLLRRLQGQGQVHQRCGIEGSPNAMELHQQLKYWQCLRQDLERARLLCELVRKREKLKALYIRTVEQAIMMQLNPLEEAMSRLLDQVISKDVQEIFTEPVDIEEVPDYATVITHPMDLSKMRSKLREGKYTTLDDMENDFNLMVQNCLTYNNKDTIFYRAGIRMRDQCAPIFKSVRKELIRDGIVEKPISDEQIAHEVDAELLALIENRPAYDELLPKLSELMEKSMRIKHGMIRQKRVKNVKAEMARAKKVSKSVENSPMKLHSTPAKATKRPRSPAETSQSEDNNDQDDAAKMEVTQMITPNCSPVKSASNNASPSGVNRRTAVLFRKAKSVTPMKKAESIPDIVDKEKAAEQTPQKQTIHAAPLQTSTPSTSAQANANDNIKVKSPKKQSRLTRNNSLASDGASSHHGNYEKTRNSPSTSAAAMAMPSTSSAGISGMHKKCSMSRDRYASSNVIPDSFRTYRGRGGQSSESDASHLSCMHSECSSCSGSEFG